MPKKDTTFECECGQQKKFFAKLGIRVCEVCHFKEVNVVEKNTEDKKDKKDKKDK